MKNGFNGVYGPNGLNEAVNPRRVCRRYIEIIYDLQMEITLEAIIGIIGLLFGGGTLGGVFTWRWARRKARAEAKEKEAEAKSAEVDMAQKVQDTYQQMLEDKQKEVEDNHRLITELREDRDHYKRDRDELRNSLEKLSNDFYDFKRETENERQKMKSDIARNTRIAESSRPFMCGLAPECEKCVPVIISDEGTVKPRKKGKKSEAAAVSQKHTEQHEIEPSNE